jgi:hypothetical protein
VRDVLEISECPHCGVAPREANVPAMTVKASVSWREFRAELLDFIDRTDADDFCQSDADVLRQASKAIEEKLRARAAFRGITRNARAIRGSKEPAEPPAVEGEG